MKGGASRAKRAVGGGSARLGCAEGGRASPPLSDQARALHFASEVVDLHADTPLLLRRGYDLGKRHTAPLPRGAFFSHVDLPRLREGGVTAQFFGLVPPPYPAGRAAAAVHRQLDALEAAVRRYPDEIALVRSVEEIRAARAAGKVAALCGIEGGHALQGSLENLRAFARRGVRYLTLAHFTANPLAAPAFGLGRDDARGLSRFGREVVEAAGELGVLVDLAHVNRRGFLDAAACGRRPPLVSHTGARGVHDLWRNIDDEQIRAVADRGGVVGVIFAPVYLGRDGVDAVAEHLLHVARVGGEDVPALGSDFDGFIVPATGLRDVSCLPVLTEALLRRGLGERAVGKILGANVLRLLREVPPAAGAQGDLRAARAPAGV